MARCSSCNAPLALGSTVCAYCGIRNDVDLKGINYYTNHEIDTRRVCPRCAISLTSIDLDLGGQFLIERCTNCLGLFFDPGELDAIIDETVKHVFQIDWVGLDGLNRDRVPDGYPPGYIKCPVCSKMMNRVNYGSRSGVVADRCRDHGIWLDGGELRRLLEWVKLGGKLLEQQRQEERKKEQLRRLKELVRALERGTGKGFERF